MPSNKWKEKLLSSSLPLEFDVAKILVSKDFAVESDFTYARNDTGVVKDFSVDIEAMAYPPFEDPNEVDALLTLLVECKYRSPNVKWLFMPDPNIDELSPFTLGCTIRKIDQFSSFIIDGKETVKFDEDFPICYKGTEIDFGNQSVHDSELKHGIAQLQYALPRLFTNSVFSSLSLHAEDNIPFFFCPILVTTAELLLTKESASISDFRKLSNVDEITTKAHCLLIYSDYGPDFEAHCSEECSNLAKLGEYDAIKALESNIRKSKYGKYAFNYPSAYGESLANAERFRLRGNFTQFVICSYSEFPKLIDCIKRIVANATETRKQI